MASRRDILMWAAAGAASGTLGPLAGCEARPPSTAAGGRRSSSPLAPIGRRPAEERGGADLGWLQTRYSFSFARYHDPAHMRFRSLRVINEDHIAPGGGFPLHPHRDMEILTYVLDGALEHEDTLGNGGVIRPGLVQRMSAGTGIRHSEFNPSQQAQTHLLQVWILPDRRGHTPSYEQKHFSSDERRGGLRLVASPDAAHGSVTIHADARIHAAVLNPGQTVRHALDAGRHAWIQVARGGVRVNREGLRAGDGAFTTGAGDLLLEADEETELLLFDLA